MDEVNLVDSKTIEKYRKAAEEKEYIEFIRQQSKKTGTTGSYEISMALGIPTHDVYPRLLKLVEEGKLEMPENDEFRLASK